MCKRIAISITLLLSSFACQAAPASQPVATIFPTDTPQPTITSIPAKTPMLVSTPIPTKTPKPIRTSTPEPTPTLTSTPRPSGVIRIVPDPKNKTPGYQTNQYPNLSLATFTPVPLISIPESPCDWVAILMDPDSTQEEKDAAIECANEGTEEEADE